MNVTPKEGASTLWRALVTDHLVSESATPIRLKYMGKANVDLDGNPEYDVFLEHGDVYTFNPARDARKRPTISVRIGSKLEHFSNTADAAIMQLLSGSQWPKKLHSDLLNIVYQTGRKVTNKNLQVVAELTAKHEPFVEPTLHWYFAPPCTLYVDRATKKHYFGFDLKHPLENMMTKVKVAKIKRAMIDAAAQAPVAPVRGKRAEIARNVLDTDTPVKAPLAPPVADTSKAGADLVAGGKREAIPVTDSRIGAGSTTIPQRDKEKVEGFGYIAALPVSAQPTMVWATYADTLTAIKSEAETQFRSLPHTTSDELAKAGNEYVIYRIVKRSPMLSQFGSKNLKQIPVAELAEKATRIRSRKIHVVDSSVAGPANIHEPRNSTEGTDVFYEYPISWSAYDVDKVRITLAQLFKRGMFDAQLKPRVTTKGLVFDYPHVDGKRGRDLVYGAVRRVYEWLHNHGVEGINVVARWKADKALVDFQFPELTAEQSASIRELMANPPTLRAPIYTLKGETHRTFQIGSFDLSSGRVVVYPVRGQHVMPDGTEVLYTSVLRLQK